MNKLKNIKVNAVLNVVKSCLSIIFPLITYPYILRTIGTSGSGKVSYVSSIISYFSLIAMLGISTYATREGARKRESPKEFETFVSEVFTINICSMIVSYILLIVAVCFIRQFQSFWLLFLILSFNVVFQVFGVDWINAIFEDYLYITVRGMLIYLVNIVLMFIFIRRPEDYYAYAVYQVVPAGIVCVTNFVYCRKYVKVHLTRKLNIRTHLRPLLVLFANALMISIYVNVDTTMLGLMKGDDAVGIYSLSTKIYSVAKSIMIALYAVTIPRLSKFSGDKDNFGFRNLYSSLWSYVSLLLVPMIIGLICLGREVILLMGGDEFIEATGSLRVLAVALLFAIYGGLITTCLNVSIRREKENLKATVFSGLINLCLNFVFIPLWGTIGAAFTTLISETFVVTFCFIRLPQKGLYMDRKKILKNIGSSGVGSVLIIALTVLIKISTDSTILRILIIIPGSVALYGTALIIMKNEYVKQFFDLAKRKLRISSGK